MLAQHNDDAATLAFFVEGMVNSRVAGAVSRAVRALDLGAVIRTDPVAQRLDVEPSSSDAEDIVEMLSSSGFTATLTADTVGSAVEWVDTRPPDELGVATMESAFALADFYHR
jgi:hypothetical protein